MKSICQKIYRPLILIFYFPIFFLEIIFFKFFGKENSSKSHQYMIYLFSQFNWEIIDFLNKFLKLKKININDRIFNSHIEIKNLDIINNNLKNEGFCKIDYTLNKDLVDTLIKSINPLKGKYSGKGYRSKNFEYFDHSRPKATKFSYDSNELIKIHIIQKLAFDKNILNIAQNYLGSLPILDIVTSWWLSETEHEDEIAAQAWHFDLDRPKWIKVFFLLTDCDENNGGHKFIRKSHISKNIPKEIRDMGYTRLNNDLISKYYEKEDIVSFNEKSGAIFFEDTRGLHKGSRLKNKKRLMLQFQYSSSLFGTKHPKIIYPNNAIDEMNFIKKRYNDLFLNFTHK